jgi:hypothetical protein
MRMIPLKDRIFEMIDGVLWVFEKGLEESGLSVNYYRKEKSNDNKRLIFLDHPTDRRYNLVAFDTLSDIHKEKIQLRFGNPYDFVAREPILKMIERNDEAHNYFLQYEYDNKKLPFKRVLQYSRATDWLDTLKKINDAKNKPIKEMGLIVPEFYEHIKHLIIAEKKNGASEEYKGTHQLPGDFPFSYRNLTQKLLRYKNEGHKMIIDPMYGNKLAAKVHDEVSEAQLLTLIEDQRQLDDVMVCMFYNIWAKENNYKLITAATVGVWRRKKEYLIIMNREGNNAYNEKFIRQVKGVRRSLSSPLALVEHDDNNLDFLFINDENTNISKYVAIVVRDSFNDLVLGKSYIVSQKPKIEQVYHAYLDAMYYIRHLTGGWHLPFEIKCDLYANKTLPPFYQKIAKVIPPAHGNKHRGFIEQSFGNKFWKRAQQLVTDPEQMNWSGNNVTAKFRGVNKELLDKNQQRRNLPFIGNQAELQIENFFHILRNMPDFKREQMDAKSKQQQWLASWEQLPIEKKRPITDEQFLLTFGIAHQPKHTSCMRITNRGLEPQIKNAQYSYDLPEAWMYNKLIGAQVEIFYDPFDMSRILFTNHDDIRYIAHTATLTPRAIQDHYTGSRTFLHAILDEKRDQVKHVGEKAARRKEIADTKYFNAEALVQGGVLVKEIKNVAEQKMIETFNKKYESFLDENNDGFDEFFNPQNKIA